MQWSRARVDVRDAAREVSQADTFREMRVYMTFPFLSHLESKERRGVSSQRHPVTLIWFISQLQPK